VDAEIENVSRMYPERVVLKNADFTTAALRENLLKLPADVVHLASHGEFLGRSEDCFFLTKDGKVSLDQLEEMIRPKKFAGIPVGLLCLSACRTAAGDDKAALGLAGAGVKSGARSVLATLWYVEDRVTADIMTGFHQRLCNQPGINKAEALRQSQLEVLREDSSLHPSFWAPFILVGSWK
jgi:CHAT domain-containing protein